MEGGNIWEKHECILRQSDMLVTFYSLSVLLFLKAFINAMYYFPTPPNVDSNHVCKQVVQQIELFGKNHFGAIDLLEVS